MKRVQWNCDKAEIVNLAGSTGLRRGLVAIVPSFYNRVQGGCWCTGLSMGRRDREGRIDQARRQISPGDFHFQRTNYSARRACVRSFVSAAFANRSASQNARVRPRQEIAEARCTRKKRYSWLMKVIFEDVGDRRKCVIKYHYYFQAIVETREGFCDR